jgi:hypothetical protein
VHDPREHFALASRHVVEADERISAQWHRIERLRRAACYTGDAEDLLRLLLQARELMLARQKRLECEMAEWRTLLPEH